MKRRRAAFTSALLHETMGTTREHQAEPVLRAHRRFQYSLGTLLLVVAAASGWAGVAGPATPALLTPLCFLLKTGGAVVLAVGRYYCPGGKENHLSDGLSRPSRRPERAVLREELFRRDNIGWWLRIKAGIIEPTGKKTPDLEERP